MLVVTVTVTNRGILVTPDPVLVPEGQHHVPIMWRVTTPGWKFTDHGIKIRKNDYQFYGRTRRKGQTFRWHVRNHGKKKYEYTIKLENRTTTASRDPGIHTGGH